MQIVKSNEVGKNAVLKLLKKPAFDEVVLSPKIREANKKLFGEDLSPSALVRKIVSDVREKGDEALFHYTKLFDKTDITAKDLIVTEDEIKAAEDSADKDVVESLKRAAKNIEAFHEEQKPKSWISYRAHGSILGQAVIPLDRVGIYVPGGTASCT